MSEATPPVRDEYRTEPDENFRVYPLTYDELDQNGANALTRLGGGPHLTPEGFKANGYDSRYTLALTSGAGAPASLRATVRLDAAPRTSRDFIVGLVPTSADQPKLEISAVPDAALSSIGQLALRVYSSSMQTLRLNRPGWRFEFRFPELVSGGVPAPQSLAFLDDDTLVLACHKSDAVTVLYRVDLTTGEYTGRASSTEFIHLNSMHVRPNGEVWANAYVASLGQNRMIRLDLAASFSAGTVTVDATWETTGLTPSIAFLEISGTEYVLCQEFAATGTAYLYVFLASQMGSPVTAADRVKRFDLGLRIQDVCPRDADGLLYASRNSAQGSPNSYGWVQSYDIAAAIASAADGATITPIATYPHATLLAEGLGFRPGDGRLWSLTEGHLTVGDSWGHCAVWSSQIPQAAEVNVYHADSHPTGLLELRVNGRLMHSVAATLPGAAATRLAIGGPPSASPGLAAGFMPAGIVRAVAQKDGLFTLDEIAALDSGAYEPHALTVTTLPLTNPGGELGTTGWTDELTPGVLGNRNAGPAPYSGSSYFVGLGAANSRARQRLALSPSAGSWARIEWQQASWDAASDPGGCGLRALDSTEAPLTYSPSGEAFVSPSQTWQPRAHSLGLPSGTAYLDAVQHRTRTVGTNVDCYIDDIVLRMYAP